MNERVSIDLEQSIGDEVGAERGKLPRPGKGDLVEEAILPGKPLPNKQPNKQSSKQTNKQPCIRTAGGRRCCECE